MKQFFKMFFASMLAMVITGVLIFFIVMGIIVSATQSVTEDAKASVDDNSILMIDINTSIHEQAVNNSLAALSNDETFVPGLYHILQAIHYAKEDKNIKGILLKVSGSPNGWATLQELRAALKDFKTSKKFIYAYAEGMTQKSYFIANVSDKVYLNPVGGFELKGLASVIPFFKNMLNKLDVEPEIFYAGKFKSATEPFRADKMSEPNKLQIREYQDDIWNVFLQSVAEKTNVPVDTIHEWASTASVQFPSQALEKNLIDGSFYWDEVEAELRNRLGKNKDYKIKYININEYASYVHGKRKFNEDKIAVLFSEGAIIDGMSNDEFQIASQEIVGEIRKIRKNKKIKAVVLRVNSPGGSALASEVILRELELLHKEKPIIVSMGDYAASGGYYISCQADSIFAMPATLTGSIGVFTMMFNTEKLWNNKLGITFDEVKNTPYADFPTFTRPLTATESQKVQATVDTIYQIFKTRVAAARNKTMDNVDSLGQGRVWTGEDAVGNGLVDAIGGIDKAIAAAANKVKLKEYQVVTYPEPVDKFQAMIKRLQSVDIAAYQLQNLIEKELQPQSQWLTTVKSFYRMNGKAQMKLPFQLEIQP